MSVPGTATPSAAIMAEATGAQPKVEGQVQGQEAQPQVQKPQQDDKFAAKFAALARKEKELRDSQGRFMSEKQKIEQERAEIEKWRTEQKSAEEQILSQIKENPLKWLQEKTGYDYETLTRMQLNEQNPTPEMLIKRNREEVESSLRKELEELKAQLRSEKEEAEKQQYEQTVKGFKSQISDFIDQNSDAYELVKMNDAQDLVFDVIQEYYESTGKVLSIEEAAKYTEEHLEADARKVLEAKKFKQTSEQKKPEQEQKAAPTLSNTLAAEVPSTGKKKLSREESLANAAKMIRWTND